MKGDNSIEQYFDCLFLVMESEQDNDESDVVEAEIAMELVEEPVEAGVILNTPIEAQTHPFFTPRKSSNSKPVVLSQAQTREQAASLLNIPNAPDLLLSDKARPRQPPIEKRKAIEGPEIERAQKKSKSSEPTHITPKKRCEQFPNHAFIVDAGRACPLNLRYNIVTFF